MSLRVQVALLVSVAVLLTCGVMFYLNIVHDRTNTLAKSDERLRLLSLYVAGKLDSRFDGAADKADQLADRITDNAPAYTKEAYDLMEQYYALNHDITSGAIVFDEFRFSRRQRLFCPFVIRIPETVEFNRTRLGDDYNYLDSSNRQNDWFTIPKNTGEPVWTLPYFDANGAEMWMMTYASPFRKDGEFTGVVTVDIALQSPNEWLMQILRDTPNDELGRGLTFLTDREGTIVSHPDSAIVEARKNIRDFLETDGNDGGFYLSGDDGAIPVRRAKSRFDGAGGRWARVARTPVGDTGWHLVTLADESEVMRDYYARFRRNAFWMALMLGLFLLALQAFTRRLTRPLIESAAFALRIRDGNLGDRMQAPKQLECGHLVNSLNEMAETIERRNRENERAMLQRENIFNRVAVVAEELTGIAVEIHTQSGEGVRDANEQKNTFSQFSDMILKFDEHTSRTADLAIRADGILQDARERAETGAVEMERLKGAMSDLIKSSADISSVLKTIDSIAFQTNLLSLNAAVEAAHAGKYGRGFGVVAEEVRQLAARSAKAATETNEKLHESEQNAEHGVSASRQTTEALEKIREATQSTSELISKVARFSTEQTELVKRVLDGLKQVGQIAEGNRKRAELEAHTAQMLRNSAEELKAMLLSPDAMTDDRDGGGRALTGPGEMPREIA